MITAMTGASGAQYGLRLLDCLVREDREVHFLISKAAQLVMATETDVLNWLILAGFIERQTAASGSWSPDDKYYAVAAQVAAPTDATLEYLKARVAVSSLTSADRDAILAKLGAAQITVNPQFGRFDPADGGLKTVDAPWIKPAPAPTA